MTSHKNVTQSGASNRPYTFGLTDNPHIHRKFGVGIGGRKRPCESAKSDLASHPDPTYIRLHPHPWPNPSHSTPSSVRTICLYGEGRRGGRRCARCFFRDREGTARVINVLSSPPLSVTPSSAAPSRALPRHPLPPLPRPLLLPPPFRHRHRHRPPSSLN